MQAIGRLEVWLQSMRGPGGFSGPVSHWWESSLLYCGPMADWRYEGIICGYVNLYRATQNSLWLERARQAADDLAAAQLPSGNFRNSSFQQGPMEGGTPHEAAADIGLLELSLLLHDQGDEAWRSYYETARTNIENYLLAKLWDGHGFRDQSWNPILVPNKNATTIEALILYEALSGQDMSDYIAGAARVILDAIEQHGPRIGGTVHTGTGHHRLAIGVYTARSMCGLLRIYERQPDDQWLDIVSRGLSFLRKLRSPVGSYFGRYPDGSLIANPQWIAGSGDLLRAMIWGQAYGLTDESDIDDLAAAILKSQYPTGGIPTGYGMARRGGRSAHQGLPEFRDVLPVVGWCDKAFRALSLIAPAYDPNSGPGMGDTARVACTWKGRACVFFESSIEMQLLDDVSNQVIFQWSKGACHPEIYQL